MTEPQYAHVVAPPITGGRHHQIDGLAVKQVAYHAARAYAFYLVTEHDDEASPRAIMHMLAHYELASLYWMAACSDVNEIDSWAADVATDLDSPHVIVPNLLTMLGWVDLDPAGIKPYGGAR